MPDRKDEGISPIACPEGHKSVEAEDGQTGLGVSQGGRGASNTPDPKYFNTCIDYLKVRFDKPFQMTDLDFILLFDLLKLNINHVTMKRGGDNYEDTFAYDEGCCVMSGGDYTKNKDGKETCVLEMKGHACRLFEERIWNALPFKPEPREARKISDEGWKRLFLKLRDMGAICTRIDLPTDDLNGAVPFAELRQKIGNKEYTSNMRSMTLQDSLPKDCDPARIRESKNQGYTATLGGRDSVQLCIYNKLAERERFGGVFNLNSWIRYEVRYYHRNAQKAFLGLTNAFETGNVQKFIVGCLKGCIDFKEDMDKFRKDGNTGHAPTWDVWDKFLAGVEENKISSRVRAESSYEVSAQWLMKSAAKALARLCAGRPELATKMLCFLIKGGTANFDEDDLAMVNNFRTLAGTDENKEAAYTSIIEMDRALDQIPGMKEPYDEELGKLFYGIGLKLGGANYSDLGIVGADSDDDDDE